MMLATIDPAWSDFYTAGGFVAGLLSPFVGIAGFWYTILQVWKTKAAAQAAEEAANQTLKESGRKFRKFVAANVYRTWARQINKFWKANGRWQVCELSTSRTIWPNW